MPQFKTADLSKTRARNDFRVALDTYEGPLDVLLDLARQKKFDLKALPLSALADQYLAFIQKAEDFRLELAAEYLVMAAWLAWLKSRLFMPEDETETDTFAPEEEAARLAMRLQHLQCIREHADALAARPRLHRDIFARPETDALDIRKKQLNTASLHDLLAAYGRVKRQRTGGRLQIKATALYSMEQLIERIESRLGRAGRNWHGLAQYLPEGIEDSLLRRSAWAGVLCASLEMTRGHQIELSQNAPWSPIMIRRKDAVA